MKRVFIFIISLLFISIKSKAEDKNYLIVKLGIGYKEGDIATVNLDEYESKEHFTLEYIPMHNFLEELEKNREIAKKDKREFIINEMKYVFSEYIEEEEKKRELSER